ncbi:MAG: PEP/pyruvate-binding domain-containing protein [Methanomassiliicoccus sp.]|nr:PEP/pyruvate-binding domain-containing protein [Methanomassiliicoccus sp.]
MVLIVPLDAVDEKNDAQVGGKAANLGKLIRGGFRVPPGIVVTVEVYDRYLGGGVRERIGELLASLDPGDETSLEQTSARIRALFVGETDDGMAEAIDRAIGAIDPHALWSVRSSAVAEDLASASFAGQQDTYLNVGRKDIMANVRRCWASYWNSRAIAYRHRAGVDQLGTGMAVVVQRMVNAHSSGIMFTSDPVSGRKDRMIVESSWGLGESIASGLVTPDRFICDKRTLRTVDKAISRKVTGIFLSVEGSRSVNIEPDRQTAPSLTKGELAKVGRMGRRVEAHFHAPQDVEWAIEGDEVFLLQSRPITNLSEGSDILWTRAYGDEYWSDVTSPLFFSLLGELLTKYVNHEGSEIMGYWNLTDKELLKVHRGHIYFNASVLEEVFTYNPKFSRTTELLNYFPQKDQARIARADTRIVQRLWAEVRIAILDNEGTIFRTDKAYRRWAEGFVRVSERLDSLDLPSLSDGQLYDEYLAYRQAGIKHYRLIRYGMVTHSIGTNLMVKQWLANWLDDRSGVYYAKLISGLEDNKTLKTNIAIAKLARAARENPAVHEALTSGDRQGTLEAVRSDPRLASFKNELEGFLRTYGHRSHTREMYFPRWADDPTLVIDVVRALVTSEVGDLQKLERDRAREREEAEKEVLKSLGRLRFGFARKLIFRPVLSYAQIYLMFRENQRFYLDHMIYRWRKLFLEYGRRLAERGYLSDPTDVFFLSKEEVFELCARGGEVKEKVEERRADFELCRDVLPPKFLRGDLEFDDTVVRGADTVRVTGVSASPGVATGRVRVVQNIEALPTVREGEIMVTSNTDPGWTAVFSKLGGLITETGGILSHGAVVSREYGIPAVTAVKDATSFFRTGQRVTLDGNDGTIYILEEA